MRLKTFVTVVTLALVALGCGGGDELTSMVPARDVSSPPLVPPTGDNLADRLGFRSAPPRDHTHEAAPSFAWKLPEGWKEIAPTQYRQGNFVVESAPEVEAYLSILPGSGGGIRANLDRWRSQMGLPPYTVEQITSLPQTVVGGRPALLVDFEGVFSGMGGAPAREGYRLLGAVLEEAGHGVFMKLVGPQADVERQRESFRAFLESLENRSTAPGSMPAGHPGVGDGAAFDPASLAWTVPEGWEVGAERQMRSVTLHPAGNREAECYLIVLPGTAGGLIPNINRWRQQIGEASLGPADVAALPRVEILGRPSLLVEGEGAFSGMSGPAQEGYGLLGAICELPSHSVYVKMTGPAAVVKAEREQFIEFCRSLR